MSRFRRLRHLRRLAYRTVLSNRSYSPESKKAIVDGLHRLYYNEGVASQGTWKNTYWLSTPVCKCPLDLWVFQEILVAVRPDIIIETGTGRRGRRLHGLHMRHPPERPGRHDRRHRPLRSTRARQGDLPSCSSPAPEIRAEVESIVHQHPDSPTVMVRLDPANDAEHVLEELRIYPRLVGPGSYLIVEGTNVNSHPVEPGFGPGPTGAIETFLSENDAFFVDTDMEKFHLTFNPGGFLKRRGRAAGDATARLGRGLVADGPP